MKTTSVWSVAFVTVMALSACNRHPLESTPSNNDFTQPRLNVETKLSKTSTVAGEDLTIRCQVTQDGDTVENGARVIITPPVPVIEYVPNGVVVRVSQSGDYDVQCETTDGKIADLQQHELRVAPGPLDHVETVLTAPSIVAGMRSQAQCGAYDAFGNAVDIGNAAYNINLAPGLRAEQFSLTSDISGTYPVACKLNSLVDTTPAILSVIPSTPVRVETSVSASQVNPRNPVLVRCEVRDIFNNLISGLATTYEVTSQQGLNALRTGLLSSPSSFSVTYADDYAVACALANGSLVDNSPAMVRVLAGLPASWIVSMHDQDCYMQNLDLPLDVFVYDEFGNTPNVPTLKVTSDPPGVIKSTTGGYRIPVEGDYDVLVEVDGNVSNVASLEPFLTRVRVDSTPPSVQFARPLRSEMLRLGDYGKATHIASGTVTDGVSSIVQLSVNQRMLSVSGSQTYERIATSIESEFGLNTLHATATDACGNRAIVSQSYLRSPSYYEPALEPLATAQVPRSVVTHLNQSFLDDGDKTDIDDLATVLTYAVRSQDLDAAIPYPMAVSPDANKDGYIDDNSYNCGLWSTTNTKTGQRVWKNGRMTYALPTVEAIRVLDDAFEVKVSIKNLVLPLSMEATQDNGCFGGTRIGGSAVIRMQDLGVKVRLNMKTINGRVQADICDTCLDLQYACTGDVCPQIDIDWGEANFYSFFLNPIKDFILYAFHDAIHDALVQQMYAALPPSLSNTLNAARLDMKQPIPAPGQGTLRVVSGIDYASFQESGSRPGAELGFFTQMIPSKRNTSIPSTARGAIRQQGELLANIPLASDQAYAFAIHDDMINQVMWSLWYTGNLNMPDTLSLLTPQERVALGVENAAMSSTFGLPPVLMPGKKPNSLLIGLGDVYLYGDVDLVSMLRAQGQLTPGQPTPQNRRFRVGMYSSVYVPVVIDIDPLTNTLFVGLDGEPLVDGEVAQTDDPAYQALMTDTLTGVVKAIIPQLLNQSMAKVPIPELDLSLVNGIPKNTFWVVTHPEFERSPSSRYSIIKGNIRVK